MAVASPVGDLGHSDLFVNEDDIKRRAGFNNDQTHQPIGTNLLYCTIQNAKDTGTKQHLTTVDLF